VLFVARGLNHVGGQEALVEQCIKKVDLERRLEQGEAALHWEVGYARGAGAPGVLVSLLFRLTAGVLLSWCSTSVVGVSLLLSSP
jgi:hypothetical protein